MESFAQNKVYRKKYLTEEKFCDILTKLSVETALRTAFLKKFHKIKFRKFIDKSF